MYGFIAWGCGNKAVQISNRDTSHYFWLWKSESKVSAGLAPPEGCEGQCVANLSWLLVARWLPSAPCLVETSPNLCLGHHVTLSLCACLSATSLFPWHQSCWSKIHPQDLILTCTCGLGLSVVSDFSGPCGLEPAPLLCPRDFPVKDTAVDCHFLLQGISPTQGSNLCLQRLLH